jgi:hypothetical protein
MVWFSENLPPRKIASLTAGLAGVAALLGGGASSSALAADYHSTAKPTVASADGAARKAQVRWVLQLKYRITKSCKIYFNQPGKTAGTNKSWTLHKGKDTTVKWRYNADSRWAVISVGGHGYPHWGFTDRTKGNTCLGTSLPQAATVRKNPQTGKWTTPVSHYPAGRPIPIRIGWGRSNQTSSHWRQVEQQPSASTITHRRVTTAENATLRDTAGFVLGNVPAGWHVDRTGVTHSKDHWTKVRVPKLHNRWGFVETRALPQAHKISRQSATSGLAAAAVAPVPAADPGTGTCHWKVIWPAAGVYSTPAHTTTPLKTKHDGDIAGQSCTTTDNPADRETYVKVTLAEGGTGWMRRNALHPA